MITRLGSLISATAAYVDNDGQCVWFTQANGAIGRVPFSGPPATVQVAASGLVGMSGSGRVLAFAHADGAISVLDTANPSAPLNIVNQSTATYGQVGLTDATGATVAVVTAPSPSELTGASLTFVKPHTGETSAIPIDGLTGVAVAGGTVFVARNVGTPLRGEVGTLSGSVFTVVATGLPPVGHLGLAEAGAVVLVAHPGAQRLSAIRLATGAIETASTSIVGGSLVEAHGLSDGRLAILTTDALVLANSLADLGRDPSLAAPLAPLFVGSWVELAFDLGTSGRSKDEVHFAVPDGLDAGFVSYTRLNGVGDPVPLLVAGGLIGTHKVALIETATATELAAAEFAITDHWTDADTGPSGFYVTNASFAGDSGWGSDSDSSQNLNVHPHHGTWRSLVLMVDTDSGRWPLDAATMDANQAEILGHVSNGITFAGETRSARQYYEENSQYVAGVGTVADRGLTLSVKNNQTYGPVNLPGSWTDYFAQKVDDNGVVSLKWTSAGGTLQTIIIRAILDGVATTDDFTDLDVLIVVPFSPDATGAPPARFVWPHASDAREFLCGTNVFSDRRSFASTFVPLDFAVHDGRQMHSTLSHELGHTLSLPDLYNFPEYSNDVTDRLTNGWDMMAGSRNALPHYTLSNKMRMGWVEAGHLKRYNFQGASAALENITLHAAELGAPPADRFRGIEIRLGDGWNYYVEYRAEQPTQTTDGLPIDRRVVITDVISDTFTAPIARPPILLVRQDSDGDGPILGIGADLEEKDPGTQMDLKVEVLSTAADNAVVQISYGSNGKPELGIRPWPGDSRWQSRDIEVRNDRSAADPSRYANTPWLGHDNTVVAKVRNSGDLLATGVVVDFFVTEYSTGDGPLVPLGSDTRDVGPGALVEFTTQWNPSAASNRHYCVIVRIRLYLDPANPAVVDQNIYNNEARSNYTRFVSASASPSTRVEGEILLANPFGGSARVFADVKKTHPQHRVFIDHQWLRVPGTGQRPIRVWDEALWGTPEWDLVAGQGDDQGTPSQLWKVPNSLSIAGWAERPFDADCGALTLTGGVDMRVDAGRATRIEIRAARRNAVSGQVVYVDSGAPITTGGTVLIEVAAGNGKYFTVTTEVSQSGSFSRDFSNEFEDATKAIEVHYLGAYSAAPSTTGMLPV